MEPAGLLSLFCLIGSAALLVRAAGWWGRSGGLLFFFVCGTGQVILSAYIVSAFEQLNNPYTWLLMSFLFLLSAAVVTWHRAKNREARRKAKRPQPDGGHGQAVFQTPAGTEKLNLVALLSAAAVCGAGNFILLLFCAPGTWDGMSYHLARIAYFLQQGSFEPYGANYWAQVVHPINGTSLLLYTFVITGSENLTQLVQFGSYWIALLVVYGIARTMGTSKRGAFFAALVFGLFTTCLMEAATARNDLLLAVYAGASIHYLLLYRRIRRSLLLVLAGTCFGLALGTKSSALLLLPSLALVAVYSLFWKGGAPLPRKKRFLLEVAGATLGFLVFTLPAGYVRNVQLFGHPMAPPDVRIEHTFEGCDADEILSEGGRNALRYGFKFLALDGVPATPASLKAQEILRFLPREGVALTGIDLATWSEGRLPFFFTKGPASHEDYSWWGILGFALVLPIGLLVLLGILKQSSGWILAAAALFFFLAQSFAGPYDPWRGRYFIFMGILLAPLAGRYLERRKSPIWNTYAAVVVLAGSLAALTSVAFREVRPLLPPSESVLSLDRYAQLFVNRPKHSSVLEQLDRIVRPDAVLAVCLRPNSYEFPLFGRGLTRRIIPINSFLDGIRPIPAEAEYLLYDHGKKVRSPFFSPNDVPLGADWYLKVLKAGGR